MYRNFIYLNQIKTEQNHISENLDCNTLCTNVKFLVNLVSLKLEGNQRAVMKLGDSGLSKVLDPDGLMCLL